MTAAQPDQPGTDLAVFNPDDSAFPVLFHQEGEGSIGEIIEDNFGEEGFSAADLPRVKIPSGGGLAWDVPDEDPVRNLDGVVVHRQQTRSMWFAKRGKGEDGENDSPPDCASTDGKIGIGAFGKGSDANPTGECAECPMNVFGTAEEGNGKKCKEKMELYLLQEGSVLPLHVSLPPTSATKPWKQYMTRLAAKGKSYSSVVTRLSLKAQKGPSGDYSVIEASKVRDLSPEEARAAKTYGSTIRAFLAVANAQREEARLRAQAEASESEPAA